jgi:hypothetical protein
VALIRYKTTPLNPLKTKTKNKNTRQVVNPHGLMRQQLEAAARGDDGHAAPPSAAQAARNQRLVALMPPTQAQNIGEPDAVHFD